MLMCDTRLRAKQFMAVLVSYRVRSFDTGESNEFEVPVPVDVLPADARLASVGLRMGDSGLGDVSWHVHKVEVKAPQAAEMQVCLCVCACLCLFCCVVFCVCAHVFLPAGFIVFGMLLTSCVASR